MLLREVLASGLARLRAAETPSAELAAELLLINVLRSSRAYLHSHPEQEISSEQRQNYFDLIAERLTGKPVQYITGHQEFWGLDFEVTPDVLIPRPETELVVETVLDVALRQQAGRTYPWRIVDVGTGSGCIALALASELPNAEIYAVDISMPALKVAIRNAQRLGLRRRLAPIQSDLLSLLTPPDQGGPFDFVVSNPPYVGVNDLTNVQREVKEFEPRLAWGGLEREDEIYRRLFPEAAELLRRGGSVVVEIGYNLRERVEGLLGEGWERVETRQDLSGIPRVVSARKA